MKPDKIGAGSDFPEIIALNLQDEAIDIGKSVGDTNWQMLIVYRGKHCPLCTKYLNKLDGFIEALHDIRVGVAVVSADSKQQLAAHLENLEIS